MKYQVIYADPPWSYGDKMAGHSFSLDHEYQTMRQSDIIAMGGGNQGHFRRKLRPVPLGNVATLAGSV